MIVRDLLLDLPATQSSVDPLRGIEARTKFLTDSLPNVMVLGWLRSRSALSSSAKRRGPPSSQVNNVAVPHTELAETIPPSWSTDQIPESASALI